jgi:aldehyde:ferredoxin oxidoreductase
VSCRVHICGKSPLTGYYGSSYSEGYFSAEMRWAGFDHLVVTGKAPKPVYLWVHNGKIEIRDAAESWGRYLPEAQQIIREQLADRDIKVLAIGPAGEKLVRFASVRTGPGNYSGRSGMGAVFGAKNLKAIAARGTLDITLARPGEALDYAVNMGRPGMHGSLPGRSDDETTENTGIYSPIIPITAVRDSREPVVAVPESALPPARYGIDATEAENLISWAIELYEEGILTEEDTGGLELVRGNAGAVTELMRRTGEREGLGDILAEGGLRAAEKIGGNSIDYLDHVRGMAQGVRDENLTPAQALSIAVAAGGYDALGRCDTSESSGLTGPELRQIYSQPVQYDGPLTPDKNACDGKAWQVLWHENLCMAADSLGFCRCNAEPPDAAGFGFGEFSKLISLVTGLEMSPMDIWTAAERANNLERMFNTREGLTGRDDRPPGSVFFSGEIDRDKFSEMLAEYYGCRGWDENGVPAGGTLKRLGLDKEPSSIL